MRATILTALLLAATGCNDAGKTVTDTSAVSDGATDFDGDGYDSDEDCDDNNSLVNPGAVELCDGFDNNCDGSIDEGVTTTYYTDDDGDGFGDPGRAQESCEQPAGHVPNGNDCDDSTDTAYPGNAEVCDGIDNNCDGTVDEGVGGTYYVDSDGDGYGDPDGALLSCEKLSGYSSDNTDCDDSIAESHPGGKEICDGIDNNCDGAVDEGVTATYYVDSDGDGFGDPDQTTDACGLPGGHSETPGDCDDTVSAINPDAAEVCDEVDNDCDGTTDESDALDASTWYADADSDGHGDPGSSAAACDQPSGYVSDDTDCDDATASTYPGADEYCDEVDNDCDGTADEGDALDAEYWYADADGDGFGDIDDEVTACAEPSGYTDDDTDCDDTVSAINPDADEVCDEVDNDCDGDVDEDSATDALSWYYDGDGDGYGDPDDATVACDQPTDYTSDDTDCDDGASGTNPGASEVCDGADNDCDGVDDNGVLGTGSACPAEDCAEILSDNSSAADGSYTLTAGTYTCDMTTDGGGWTLVKNNAYVYGTGYDTSYYNTEGFTWDEVLFAYDSGSVHAHCTYPSSLTGCNNLGFQFGSANWGVALNWGSSICGMATTSYTSSTTYIGGYDFVISRSSTSTTTIRLGTLEGVSSCTTSDNPGSAYVDIYVRR